MLPASAVRDSDRSGIGDPYKIPTSIKDKVARSD